MSINCEAYLNVMNIEEMCLIATAVVLAVGEKKKKRKRRIWVKSWLSKRDIYSHVNLINELKLQPDDYRNYLRVDEKEHLCGIASIGCTTNRISRHEDEKSHYTTREIIKYT